MQKKQSAATRKKCNVTITEAKQLFAAMCDGLDGYTREVGGQTFKQFYELGVVRLDIARNVNRLKPIIDDFDAARIQLIRECTGGGKVVAEAMGKPWEDFRKGIDEMVKRKTSVELSVVQRSSLKLDVNPISVGVLALMESHGLIKEDVA